MRNIRDVFWMTFALGGLCHDSACKLNLDYWNVSMYLGHTVRTERLWPLPKSLCDDVPKKLRRGLSKHLQLVRLFTSHEVNPRNEVRVRRSSGAPQ